MSTLDRLKELSAEFQDEMSGISMEEFREIMNTLPKLLAAIDAGDELAHLADYLVHPELQKPLQEKIDQYRKVRAEVEK